MPIILRIVEVFGALDRIRELGWDRAAAVRSALEDGRI
jgi:hypothetical protein